MTASKRNIINDLIRFCNENNLTFEVIQDRIFVNNKELYIKKERLYYVENNIDFYFSFFEKKRKEEREYNRFLFIFDNR